MSNDELETKKMHRAAAGRLLALLKTGGPRAAGELGAALGVTGEAVRQQLVRLSADGLVESRPETHGVGRPVLRWSLTGAGHARFPDRHGELTVQLIRAVRTELGQVSLERLIDARAAEARTSYAAALAGSAGLGERVARLAALRSREGYMAEWQPDVGGYLLVENHCPICAAATECQGFCRSELEVFAEALGPDVSVERTDHIVAGARRCVYRIRPKGNEAAAATAPPVAGRRPADRKGDPAPQR